MKRFAALAYSVLCGALTLAGQQAPVGQTGRGAPPSAQQRYRSKITVYDLPARSSTVLDQADQVLEAPNWSRDGRFLLANTGGSLYRLPVNGTGEPKLEKIDLGEGGY